MKKIIYILFLCLTLSGCSFLKTISAPLQITKNSVPQSTSKSKLKEVCKGKIEFDENGQMISCSKGYYNYEEAYNNQERKLKWNEKLGQMVSKTAGWIIIISIALFFFAPTTLALIAGRFVEGSIGLTAKVAKALVTGIQKGKKYVRSNGSNYSPGEQVIYQKGADDMLQKISENITDQKVKEEINKLRAKV